METKAVEVSPCEVLKLKLERWDCDECKFSHICSVEIQRWKQSIAEGCE